MADFRFTVLGEACSVSVDEEEHSHPSSLTRSVEEQILAFLTHKSIELHPREKRFLQSKIAVATTPHALSRGVIDLGNLDITGPTPPPPPLPAQRGDERPVGDQPSGSGQVYKLINIKIGSHIERPYRPEQSIGAIAADIRQLNRNLGINDKITLFQVVSGQSRELMDTMLVRDLVAREIYWEVQSYL